MKIQSLMKRRLRKNLSTPMWIVLRAKRQQHTARATWVWVYAIRKGKYRSMSHFTLLYGSIRTLTSWMPIISNIAGRSRIHANSIFTNPITWMKVTNKNQIGCFVVSIMELTMKHSSYPKHVMIVQRGVEVNYQSSDFIVHDDQEDSYY